MEKRPQKTNAVSFSNKFTTLDKDRNIEDIESKEHHIRKLEHFSAMSRDLAHKFNNLLAGVVGKAGIAQMALRGHDIENARLALIDLENNALQARTLTQQLLNFSNLAPPKKEALSLEALVYEAVTFSLSGSRHRCVVEAEGVWALEGDRSQIVQLVSNLLFNAHQAMQEPGRIIIRAENVEVTAEQERAQGVKAGPYVRVAVVDQGPGVPAQVKEHIFEPFFSTKHERSGLGLACAQAIVKAHGGWMEVEDHPEGGAVFAFYLPASPQEIVPEEAKPSEGLSRPLRILVMDDEKILREVLRQILTELGHTVVAVPGGLEAVAEYQTAIENKEPYDLVILDLTVPGGVGGKETIHLLRRIDPEVKALASSGYANDPIMKTPNEFGFTASLPKPYSVAELQQTLYAIFKDGPIKDERQDFKGTAAPLFT